MCVPFRQLLPLLYPRTTHLLEPLLQIIILQHPYSVLRTPCPLQFDSMQCIELVELLFVAGERIIKVNVCTLSSHQPNYKRRGPGKTKMHTTITITLQCTKLIMINQSPAFSIVTSSVYQDTHHLIVRISVFKRDICIWEII